ACRRTLAVERRSERIEDASDERRPDGDLRASTRDAYPRAGSGPVRLGERRRDEHVATEAHDLELHAAGRLELAADRGLDALDLEELSDGVAHAPVDAHTRRAADGFESSAAHRHAAASSSATASTRALAPTATACGPRRTSHAPRSSA